MPPKKVLVNEKINEKGMQGVCNIGCMWVKGKFN